MSSIKSETVKSAKWSFLQTLTVQPVQMVFGMVLARLITPSEMGILGLTAIFFAVAGCLAEAGFGAALIRKSDMTEEDVNTTFWYNLLMSFVLSLALFLLAPWFASFYQQPELLWLTRVSAVMMLIMSTTSVHKTLFQRRRDFRTLAKIGMLSAFSGMPVCLLLAWLGWGVWALMVQNLVASFVSLSLLWIRSPWKPRFVFSTQSFRDLFGFGSKLACASLLHTLYTQLRTFIIGKFYSAAQLGLYSRGQHLAELAPSTINSVLSSITYPILATIQHDDERLSKAYRKYIKVSTVCIAWLCVLMASLAAPGVYILYGASWVPCAVYIQILSFAYAFDHICSINLNLLKVKGCSGILLKLEVIKKSISVAILIYAATIGVEAICWGMVIYTQIAVIINSFYTGKLINLSWWRQQRDYMPYFVLAFISVIPAYCFTQCELHPFFQILLGGGISVLIYFGVLYAMKEEAFCEIFSEMKIQFRKKFSGVKKDS